MADDQQPKIIVDDDWKTQAQAEKDKLREQSAPKGDAGSDGAAPDPNRPIGFIDLVQMLATQALMYLGAFPDPQTGKAMISLDMAKLHIDLLGVVEEKTKGNLTDEEEKATSGMANELRMQYVEMTKAVQRAVAEGRIGPNGELSGGLGGSEGASPLQNPPA